MVGMSTTSFTKTVRQITARPNYATKTAGMETHTVRVCHINSQYRYARANARSRTPEQRRHLIAQTAKTLALHSNDQVQRRAICASAETH